MTLTRKGRAIVDRMAVDHAEFARLLFAEMPDDRLAALVRGLDDVLERLRPLVRAGSAEEDGNA